MASKFKVSDVMSMNDGPGFHISPAKGGSPLVSLEFETEDDAKQAREEIERTVAKAVAITGQGTGPITR
jgi:hypothetical protein